MSAPTACASSYSSWPLTSLEHFVFQFAGLRRRTSLAADLVGTDFVDDRHLPQGGPSGRLDADSLPALGHFCRLPQLWRMDAELTKARQVLPAGLLYSLDFPNLLYYIGFNHTMIIPTEGGYV